VGKTISGLKKTKQMGHPSRAEGRGRFWKNIRTKTFKSHPIAGVKKQFAPWDLMRIGGIIVEIR
jgi:hypothetical protein